MSQAAVVVDTHADGERVVITVYDNTGNGVVAVLDQLTALSVVRDILGRIDTSLHGNPIPEIVVEDIR